MDNALQVQVEDWRVKRGWMQDARCKKSRQDNSGPGRQDEEEKREGGGGREVLKRRLEAVCGGGTRVVWRGRPSVQVDGGKRGTGQLVP
jgi:hypothetical protein